MALAVGSRVVVLDGRHFEGFRSGSRGTVIDVDRDSGCCRVAFDDSPSAPVKVAIRHLGAEVSGRGPRFPVFARTGKELSAEDQAGDALGEAIRACAEATTSLCAASMMEVVAVRQDMRTLDKDFPSSEQLAARMSRLEQRVQALDESLGRTLPKERVEAKLAHRISRLEQLQVSQPVLDKVGFGGPAAAEALAEDMRQQQRALQDLKSQFERSLNQLAEQLQEVVRSHSRLQTEINAAQARPHVEPGYSSALRTLTGNVEDLKSLMEHSPLHGRTRIDGAASPQTLRPTTSPAASSTGAFHFTSAQAFCAKCGSQHAPDEIFCRKCGHKREQASGQEAALVEASPSPSLLRSR
mmetsp:Transcript_21822/g.44971  ORF Transcript_21822/g.44971 Transcript_21822/m.44971 type:complete len:354 (+) Transcript_21822:28-1089(+)